MDRLETNIVGPDGPLWSHLCYIGQAPGREEDEHSPPKPFVGAAGRLFNRCLRTVGQLRSEVLVNNIFRQRPPKNKVEYYFEDKKKTKLTWEGEEHVAVLEQWLRGLLGRRSLTGEGPNVLVAMGYEAMYILTGKRRISKWRGSVLPCTLVEGFKVYVTYHPSFINRTMNERPEALQGQKKIQAINALPLFLKDLERAEMQSAFPEIQRPKRKFVVADTLELALRELAKLEGEEYVGVDIETLRGSDGPILWMIGFAPRPDYAFVIPFITNQRFHWSLLEEAQVLTGISRFFLSEVKKIFQGGSYDLSVLGRYYGLRLRNGTYEDTMLCHHASFPTIKKALETLTSIHTWEPYYKDDGKVWDGRRISDEAERIYNCKDTSVTREVFPPILRDARELRTEQGYRRTLSVFPSILYMQIRGVKIDLERKANYAKELQERIGVLQLKMNFLAGKAVLPDSPQQLSRLLYTEMGMPFQYHPKTKKVTTDIHALQKLARLYDSPGTKQNKLLLAIIDYRKTIKLYSTYAEMEVDSDGRIHTSYGWISTWRLSSSESHFGKGGNLQNIPVRSEQGREIRRLFIPDKGNIFLAGDYIQAEAMVVAWLAGDPRLMDLYLSGVDVHWERTKELFEFPSSLEYHPKELMSFPGLDPMPAKWFRDLTKRFVHGGNYKMGFRKQHAILVSEGINIPLNFCKQAMISFRNKEPLTVQWQNKVAEKIRRDRTLITPLGRKREFRGRLSDDLIRSAVAFVPQSTVGEMTQLGTKNLYEKERKFEPLLNNHDEVLGQCKVEDLLECGRALHKHMTIPLEINGKKLIIPLELKSGPNWGDLKDLEVD